MPGDPLRAKRLAETYLENVEQFNGVRNMLGYTGTYQGNPVSVMGSGMGMPSIGIYSYELYNFYGVESIVRIGTAGGVAPDVRPAADAAERLGYPVRVGNVLSSDVFYDEDPTASERWAKMGVLAVEMESAALYLNAMRARKRALTILTVTDVVSRGEALTAEERQESLTQMMEVALSLAAPDPRA